MTNNYSNIKIFFWLCILLFYTANSCFAQSRLGKQLNENSIWCTSSREGSLYSGIDNSLQIDKNLRFEYDTFFLSTNNGQVIYDSNSLILLVPDRLGKLRLNFYGIQGDDTISEGYKYFTVKGVPSPTLTLNDFPIAEKCTLARQTLLTCDSLGIFFSKDLISSENWLKVTRFSLGYTYGGFYISHINTGNKFTTKTKQILSQIGPDREITIRPTVEAEGNVTIELPIYKILIY
jgi:hypothetical protein